MPRILAASSRLPLVQLEGLGNVVFLDLLERFADQGIDPGDARRSRRWTSRACRSSVRSSRSSSAVGVHHDHAFDGVPQLADVSRPCISQQHLAHGRSDRGDRLAVRGGELLEKVLDQERDVVAPLAQGGSLTLTTLRR